MASKYGNFSEPSYISIGDPFGKKIVENSRNTGLNMKAAIRKTGKTNDATFDTFVPLYKGEKYEKNFKEKREDSQALAAQMSSQAPFRPSNPQKKSSGLGNYYGCVGPKWPHQKDFADSGKKKGDFEVGARNVVTNPSKKGTYGFRGTSLGEKVSTTGAVGEYSYMSDKYDAARVAEIASSKASMAKRVSDNPFKPASPPKKGGAGVPGRTLAGKKKGGVCGEYTYVEDGPQKHVPDAPLERPFRPSHPPKEGYNSTLNKFPNYMEDPLDLKLKREKEARKAEMDRMDAQPKFIPPSSLKSGATTSILRQNLV